MHCVLWGFHLEAVTFHLSKAGLPYLWQTEYDEKYQFHTACNSESGWEFKGVKNRTKGQSVGPNLKPCGPVEMACAVSAVSRAAPHIRVCLHSACLLQSLTAGKTSPLLWAQGQEKPLLPPSRSKRDIQTVSLTQPQNPTTGWLRETERKMTGDKLWGGKRFIFSLNQMKGLGTWISQLVFLKQRSSVWHAKPLSRRRPGLLSVGWNKRNSMCFICRKSEIRLFYVRYISGCKCSLHLQMDLLR